ncbi:MAG: alpha/beta hydrolase, partial [Flavobacteriaceae bacterium]|nr:alpha/beta hydrolase [Flavobacteriaceae bacterium]
SCSPDNAPIDELKHHASFNEAAYLPLEAEVISDISYGKHPQQVFDLYLPAGRSMAYTKILVLIHGGGWINGDKEDMSNFVAFLQEYHPDHAIVNLNYRLAVPGIVTAFPSQFYDVGSAIKHIIQKSEEYQLSPEFGLIGASAGAHLAMQYDYVYDTDNVVKFVGDIVGPTDFTDPHFTTNPNFQYFTQIFIDEEAYPLGTNLITEVSPALRVSEKSSPTIMFYGKQDNLVPISNASTLDEKLNNYGIAHSFTKYNEGHGGWNISSIIDMQSKLSAFIDLHLPIDFQ